MIIMDSFPNQHEVRLATQKETNIESTERHSEDEIHLPIKEKIYSQYGIGSNPSDLNSFSFNDCQVINPIS